MSATARQSATSQITTAAADTASAHMQMKSAMRQSLLLRNKILSPAPSDAATAPTIAVGTATSVNCGTLSAAQHIIKPITATVAHSAENTIESTGIILLTRTV